eukprot:2255663-Rhodomonas_salina.2
MQRGVAVVGDQSALHPLVSKGKSTPWGTTCSSSARRDHTGTPRSGRRRHELGPHTQGSREGCRGQGSGHCGPLHWSVLPAVLPASLTSSRRHLARTAATGAA